MSWCRCAGSGGRTRSGSTPAGRAPAAGHGGQGGDRTHGTLAGSPVFETGAIDHSATCPYWSNWCGRRVSNPRQSRCKRGALPSELQPHCGACLLVVPHASGLEMVRPTRFELAPPTMSAWCSAAELWPRLAEGPVPAERIELPTFALRMRCTAAVLRRHPGREPRDRTGPSCLHGVTVRCLTFEACPRWQLSPAARSTREIR